MAQQPGEAMAQQPGEAAQQPGEAAQQPAEAMGQESHGPGEAMDQSHGPGEAMALQPGEATQLLKQLKAKLIDILFFEPDYVRQHAHSRSLLSDISYNAVGDQKTRREQVTHLLDSVMEAGDEKAKGLLELLKEDGMQTTYPRLAFLKELPQTSTASSRNNEEAPRAKENIPRKRKADSNIVTEKQLMEVAKRIGTAWRKIGISLGITEVKLQQIEANNPMDFVDRVYQMLYFWRKGQKKNATAAYLHSKLTELDEDLVPDDIDFLLEED